MLSDGARPRRKADLLLGVSYREAVHVIPSCSNGRRTRPGGTLEVYSVEHSRTFYIDDAIEMIIRAAESPRCEGGALNIGARCGSATSRRPFSVP